MSLDAIKRRWDKCKACRYSDLTSVAQRKVYYRGDSPCDVLFVAEAPGVVEDSLGKPLVGPAGKLMDAILGEVKEKTDWDFTTGFANVLACFPGRNIRGDFNTPTPEEAGACQERLIDVIQHADPHWACVCLGRIAERFAKPVLEEVTGLEVFSVYHPAFILRKGGPTSVEYRKVILQLTRLLGERPS